MAEVLSTNQVAERLGIAPGTVRTWKKRYEKQLIEGQHWVSQDGSNYWTITGLEFLTAIKNGSPETLPDPEDETVSDSTETPLLERYSSLLDAIAQALTPNLLDRLDRAVMTNIKQSVSKPINQNDCVVLLTELGLKPVNPKLLLSDTVTALLTEHKE